MWRPRMYVNNRAKNQVTNYRPMEEYNNSLLAGDVGSG